MFNVDRSDFGEISSSQSSLSFHESSGSVNPRRECFNVSIQDDTISEDTESFLIVLNIDPSLTQDRAIIDPPETEIFILDDDGMTMNTS